MQYALVSPTNEIDRIQGNINPDVSTKLGWRWLPYIENPIPVIDTKTKILRGPFDVVLEHAVEQQWQVLEKQKKDYDLEKIMQVESISESVLVALLDYENRIRLLEKRNVINVKEFKNYLVSLL